MENTTNKRKMKGIVVSTKMDKTAVIKVDRSKVHSKYNVRFTRSKRYKAHDPENKYKVGEIVIIEESRPLSKDKKWRITRKVEKKK